MTKDIEIKGKVVEKTDIIKFGEDQCFFKIKI